MYEYKILVTTMVKTMEEFEELINKWARDGWRVACVSPAGHLVMERKVEDE